MDTTTMQEEQFFSVRPDETKQNKMSDCDSFRCLRSKLTILVSVALPWRFYYFSFNRPVQSNLRWGCDQKTAVSDNEYKKLVSHSVELQATSTTTITELTIVVLMIYSTLLRIQISLYHRVIFATTIDIMPNIVDTMKGSLAFLRTPRLPPRSNSVTQTLEKSYLRRRLVVPWTTF